MSKGSGWDTASDRFWSKVDKAGPGGCWLWTAPAERSGYGYFGVAPNVGRMAHRFSFEELVGPIPDGLTLDHLCRVRRCVNPAHLEAVSMAENRRRVPLKDACVHGHEFTPENTYVRADTGHRTCRECDRRRSREWQSANRPRLNNNP